MHHIIKLSLSRLLQLVFGQVHLKELTEANVVFKMTIFNHLVDRDDKGIIDNVKSRQIKALDT